jgi:hypothetical protein
LEGQKRGKKALDGLKGEEGIGWFKGGIGVGGPKKKGHWMAKKGKGALEGENDSALPDEIVN